MKEGWEIKTLGDVATFINGDRSTNYPSKKDYVADGVPFVNAGNIIPLGLDIASLNLITQSKYDSLTQGKFVEDDILFCLRGTLGKHSIVQKGLRGAIASSLVIIRTKDGFSNRYISYFLDYKQPFIERLNNGAAQPNIPAKTMKGLSILLPSNKNEQQSIVDYLDSAFAKIDALKANAEKALNEAKALFQASLKEMLEPKEGWEEKTLKEITTKISDGSHNPPVGLDFSEYEMLSSKNLRKDSFNFDNPRYLSKEDFEKEDKRTNLEKGDVLLTIVGAGLGDCCVYNFEKKIVFQRSVSVIKPSRNKIMSRFLMYTLQNNYDSIRGESNGAAQKGIYLKQLAAYSVVIPSLQDQHSIVSTLDSLKSKVDRLQENYDKISQECDALKQAILKQVFE